MDISEIPVDELDVITASSYGEQGHPHEACCSSAWNPSS